MGGARFIARLPVRRSAASVGDRRLERPAARRVVDEHVEAGRRGAEEDGRDGRRVAACPASERRAPGGPGRPPGGPPSRGRRARSVMARPAARKAASSVGPLSPIRTAATARSATTGGSADRSTPLSRPPAISTTGASNALERGDHRVRLGPLRVVDEADAIDQPDRLEAVLDAGEGRGGAPDRVRLDAESQCDGDRGERVRDVVRTRDRELGDRHDRGRGRLSRRRHSPASEALDAVGHDPAVDHARARRPVGRLVGSRSRAPVPRPRTRRRPGPRG